MTDINSRKTDHIALASKAKHQAAQGSGFDRLRFEPKPMFGLGFQNDAQVLGIILQQEVNLS